MANSLLQPSRCVFQLGDKVTWEITPPGNGQGVVGELSGKLVALQQDTALVAVQGTDGEVYRKVDVNRLYIKVGWKA